jgi:subtilisin family serine protease
VPNASFAANNLFDASPRAIYRTAGEPCRGDCKAFQVTAWSTAIAKCSQGLTIGLVDTGIDTSHRTLADASIEVLATRREDRRASEKRHGTAVASLLVGRPDGDVPGLLPMARLVAVDPFHNSGRSDQSDTFDLVLALRLLAEQNVTLVNMSLTGPDNPFLAEAVIAAQSAGMTIVAAAGLPSRNGGYPARYPGVVAVAAVDGRLRASRLSARGNHIAFAAPGTGLVVAAPEDGLGQVDGTSFATPFVTAAYAVGLMSAKQWEPLTSTLSEAALDLGRPGHDPVYGWGLLQYSPLRGC